MPYETGAKVRLTRDVRVTGEGSPGPLSLAEGLEGFVEGFTEGTSSGGVAQSALDEVERISRAAQLTGFSAAMMDQVRQQVTRHAAAYAPGAGGRAGYRVRFVNGFVLDGVDEDALTRA
ncbi:hypothetical protein ABT117_34345 [Streptomyces sp. NPDC002262]|uniref:hypothetical protein n=1 Tax=unclassified Streptomyces TaxID=2593676 RepID=UPI00332118AC